MDEILILLLSVFLGGLGYFIVNWHLGPVLRYRELQERIASTVIFRMNILANASYGSPDAMDQGKEATSSELRQLACELRGLNNVLDRSKFLRALCKVPSQEKLHEVAGKLIFLSNSLSSISDDFARELNQGAIYDRIAGIENLLGIDITESAEEIARLHIETADAINRRRKGET